VYYVSIHVLVTVSEANEYGYAIYRTDTFAESLRRGRFADSAEGSFVWIDGRGVDTEVFGTITKADGTVHEIHEKTKIPGIDIDVI